MPMSFGTSCEPSQEGSRFAKKRKQQREKKPLAERMDAFERIIALCAVRDRSTAELRERLQKDGYTHSVAEEAIERACECGLVDDMRFAEAFIRGKIAAGKGQAGIERELEKHGISIETLEGWPEEFGISEEDQVQTAVSYLELHPPKAKDAWGAGFRKLVSKGYSVPIASKAVRIWAESTHA